MSRGLVVVAIGAFAVAALSGPILLLTSAERGSAAFGDNETIGVNRLSAATVDIEPGSTGVPITATNLAPGDRIVGSIAVHNAGTLPVRYALVSDGSIGPLSPWLSWEIWPRSSSTCDADPEPAELLSEGPLPTDPGSAVFGDVNVGLDPGDRVLRPGQSEELCTAVTLMLRAPDEVQAQTQRQDFVVVAEQHTDDLEEVQR